MEDEGVRALYAPRETTSVWRAHADPETAVVATLAQMGDVGIPTRSYNTDAEIVDPARYSASGMVQIQIVKRNGKFVPVVDGLVPPTQTDANGNEKYVINHHRGMHTDEETQSWVFSPCAVSVCVEDGQPLPERCIVSVWQHVAHTNGVSTLVGGRDRLKLGERAIEPFKVSDHTAPIVYTPYPIFHVRPPRIIINDMSSIILYREKKGGKAIWNIFRDRADMGDDGKKFALHPFLLSVGPLMLTHLAKKYSPISMQDFLQAATPIFGLYEMFKDTVDLSLQGTGFENVWQIMKDAATSAADAARGYFAMPDADPDIIERAFQTQWRDFISFASGAFGILALWNGIPAADAIIAIYGADVVAQMNSVNGVGFVDAVTNSFNLQNFVTASVQGLKAFMDTRPQPQPAKRYFSIAELAKTIESLTATVPLSKEELERVTDRNTLSSEAVVLQWLVASDPKSSNVLSDVKIRFQNRFGLGDVTNIVDLSEFITADSHGVQTYLHIDIEDATGDAWCQGQASTHFEFHSNRRDKKLLGLAAAGGIRDLERLQTAILAFDVMLSKESKNIGKFEKFASYFDYNVFQPFFMAAMAHWKYLRSNNRNVGSEANIRNAMNEQRATTLRFVRQNLQTKLYERFVAPHSEGSSLLRALTVAVKNHFLGQSLKDVPKLVPPPVLRELPQKVQYPVFLFPTNSATDSNYVDVQIDTGTMREYSSLHDAVSAGTNASRSAMAAIAIKHREWETMGQRCLFVHAFGEMSDWNTKAARHRLRAPSESYSLVLQLPGDIRNAEAVAALGEETKRRILTLCHKGEAAAEATTPLDQFKLHNTEEALIAMSLFAELWTDELLKLHGCTDPTLRVVSAAETAQARAAARCVLCGQFLHNVTMQEWSGLVPMLSDDPALLATQAGRDAGRLARRMQLAAQPKTTRGVLSRALVKRVRDIGAALRLTGNRLAAKPDAQLLPSEPLQALFMDPAHGVRAYKRANAFVNLDPSVVEAIAGAYPSSLLLVSNTEEASISNQLQFTTPQRPPVPYDVAVKVQERMAALRFDYPDTVHLDSSKTHLHTSTEDLTKAMSSLSVARGAQKLSYYVPYGHGHAPPRVAYPPVPTPMFGSVPVWVGDAIAAIDALLRPPPAEAGDASEASIFPIFPCEANDASRPLPAHPALINAHVLGSGFVDVCFWASEPELTNGSNDTDNDDDEIPTSAPFAHDAATRHLQQEDARKLSSRVSTLAWNSERILQALLLLTDPGLDASPVVQLMLSNGDARVAVPERGEPEKILKARLEKELEDATFMAKRDANWHLAELRRTMNLIEAHLSNPEMFAVPPDADNEEPPPLETVSDPVSAPMSDTNVSRYLLANVDHRLHEEMDTDAAYLASLLEWAGYAAASWAVRKGASKVFGFAEPIIIDWWRGPTWMAELFSRYTILGVVAKAAVAKAAVTLAKHARWWNQRRLTAREAERLQQRDKGAKATGSTSTAVSANCALPFLHYSEEKWESVFKQDMETKTRRLGEPVDWLGLDGKTFAKELKEELNRLRDPKLYEIDDLINGIDCPPRNAWEEWIENSEVIVQRVLDVFLDDAVVALKIAITPSSTTAVPNPVASKRQEAYENVVRNLNGLYGNAREPYAEAVNLVYLRHCAVVSAHRYREAKQALDDYERARLAREAEHQRVRQVVRAHTMVAAVIGTAMARNVLGSGAPHVRTLRAPDQAELDDQSVMHGKLQELRATLVAGAGSTTALRLGELCAIAQSVLG
jgi:hypothetical protein